MPKDLKSKVKVFADDTPVFSIVKNKNDSAKDFTYDLSLISKWVFKWKTLFIPDSRKPAQEIIFFLKKDDCSSKCIF